MSGLAVVFWKELADYFGSRRFIILFLLILIIGLASVYAAGQTINEELTRAPTEFVFLRLFTSQSGALPSFIALLSLIGPLIGIILGFDAINSEHSRGTASLVLAQPLFRDSWINGKFTAGLATLAIMLISIIMIISGMGLNMLGFGPTGEELLRIGTFFVMGVLYIGFWLSLGILFSVIFRNTTSSALASIAVWAFFALFMYMFAGLIADQMAPIGPQAGAEAWIRHEQIQDMIMRISPTTLFAEATTGVLVPSYRGLGLVALVSEAEIPTNPLSLGQSLLIVWPQLVSIIALAGACFAVSYAVFMRQEIRST
ncbi:MAG TPA: ABC transporter permease [Chloroflexi bacterium]|nr:ABC transporter permease [Chloroflexota bacterium]